MASRPVFIPEYRGPSLVKEQMFEFTWAPGFAEVQKKKNICALHEEAHRHGINNILEISSKSAHKLGKRLSAFSLQIDLNGISYPLESVYQGSKVFEDCGPFPEIFSLAPREAKKFIRNHKCGRLKHFFFEGRTYPLSPKNAFYDWLYIKSLENHADWIERNVSYDAFTDIEFNPTKQINCQARAFAEFMSLMKKSKLSQAASNFDFFVSMLPAI